MQERFVGCLEGSLWRQDEDGTCRGACGEQGAQPLHTDCGLAAAGGAGQEDFRLDGSVEQGVLRTSELHLIRLAESDEFVNQDARKPGC
jgi:hypothetical protein